MRGGADSMACMKVYICDEMRSNLETMEEFEVEGDQLVRIIAEDMDLGFRRVAYLGFANLPGVTRY